MHIEGRGLTGFSVRDNLVPFVGELSDDGRFNFYISGVAWLEP